MDVAFFDRIDDASRLLEAQRACFTPTDRELSGYLLTVYGSGLDDLGTAELATARLVFAQVALMAGAALAADSETFVGAEHLWHEMQDRIGSPERALAKQLLETLSRDEYYSDSERYLIARLARTISLPDASIEPSQQPDRAMDHEVESGEEEAVAQLRLQRDALAPSVRELTLLLQSGFGRGPDAFLADEVATARTLFAQVVLMLGAALTGDAETYLAAERLWSDMQERIGSDEREFARRLLDLLSRDAHYSESERRLIRSLVAGLTD